MLRTSLGRVREWVVMELTVVRAFLDWKRKWKKLDLYIEKSRWSRYPKDYGRWVIDIP
jgi:hypothetical protein